MKPEIWTQKQVDKIDTLEKEDILNIQKIGRSLQVDMKWGTKKGLIKRIVIGINGGEDDVGIVYRYWDAELMQPRMKLYTERKQYVPLNSKS